MLGHVFSYCLTAHLLADFVMHILQAHYTCTQTNTRLLKACRAEGTSGVGGRVLIGPRLGVTFIVLTEGIRGRHSKAEVISSPLPYPPLLSVSNRQAQQWRRLVRAAISCPPKLFHEGQSCLTLRSGCLALTSVGSL